jgi:hypothetical protein
LVIQKFRSAFSALKLNAFDTIFLHLLFLRFFALCPLIFDFFDTLIDTITRCLAFSELVMLSMISLFIS